MRVLNLYGGPGTGKSTTAAAVFARAKVLGHDVELVREFAKDLVWQGRQKDMRILGFILGEQSYRLATVAPQVKFTITDSPILLTKVYEPNVASGHLARNIYDEYDNLNVFLERQKTYNPNGRNETEEQARQKDDEIYKMLVHEDVEFFSFKCTPDVDSDILVVLESKGWL